MQYADDTILFLENNVDTARNLKNILTCFEQVSGMRINYNKSELVPINLSDEDQLGGIVALQRKANQQLRAAQAGPAAGSVVQCVGEVIGLGHEMPRASGGHYEIVSPLPFSATPSMGTPTGPHPTTAGLRHGELMFATDKPIVVPAANSSRSPETKMKSGSTSSSAEAR